MGSPVFATANVRSVSIQLKVVYGFLLWSVVVEWFAAGLFPAPKAKWPVVTIEVVFAILALAGAAIVLYFRFARVRSCLERAASGLSGSALAKLRADYLVCFFCTEAVAVYGMLVRMAGDSAQRAGVFFVVAVVFFALCFPRVPTGQSVPPAGPSKRSRGGPTRISTG